MIGSQESKESLIRSGGNMNDLTSLRDTLLDYFSFGAPNYKTANEAVQARARAIVDDITPIVAQEVQWELERFVSLPSRVVHGSMLNRIRELKALTRTPPLSGKEQL